MYVLLGIPLLAIVPVAFYFGGPYIAAASLILALLLSISVYRYSPKLLLKWYKCRKMPPARNAELNPSLTFLASEFSIPCPEAYTFASAVPIVFTVGNGRNYSVVISEGALDILDEDEMKAVLTCETAKIASGSVPLNTVVALVAGTVASLSTVAMWMSMLAGFGQEKDAAPRFARFLGMGLVSLPAALLVHLFSVNSTFRSDEMAARVMADVSYLSGSLCRMNNYIRLHCIEDFNPGHVHMFLLNPLRVNDVFDVYSSMFMIKPDFERRLSAIGKISDTCNCQG
ncbi:M48 family metalloprotease [Methanolobus sp.]|uniref:M48 family metalloprotease n=1 Tax=Methanolobus sp. TaxID=1874737 RepID=UPI0025DE159A|nr:M48 family metalloprotease [Methanolobus sp.]